MTWLPNPKVTINGTDYTGRAVEAVTVRRGRDTVYASPVAGYATVELLDVNEGSLGFDVGAELFVTVENFAGTAIPVFTGRVADWSSNVIATGSEPVVAYSVQAVGPLAILNRRNVLFGGRPSETDGDRVAAAITASLPQTWEEFNLTRTWSEMGDLTWNDVDPGFDLSLIDPGVYTLVELDPQDSGYSALNVVSEAGSSAKGLLFETPDGLIGYADANRRPANAGAGFLNVPFSVLTAGGLSLSSSLADITNRVTVTYGDDDAVTETDVFSLTRFGLQETRLQTSLDSQSDAEARADDFLFSHSLPSIELEEVAVNLRGLATDQLRNDLLNVNSNDAVAVTGLPAKLGFGPAGFRGFVEGLTIRINEFEADISFFVSDELLSFGSVLWGQVDATITWDGTNPVDPTLTWADARRVTV